MLSRALQKFTKIYKITDKINIKRIIKNTK